MVYGRGTGGIQDLGRDRRVVSRGMELLEVLKGLPRGATGALDAPLELGEGFAAAGGGLTERVLRVGPVVFLMVVGPDLGFGGTQAALEPFSVNEVVHEGPGFGGSGVVTLVVFADELLEVGEVLRGKDEGLGVNAGFEGIHGGGGFACDRGGAGGFLRVAAVGFDLTEGRHNG
jgi:hypothetical protein